MGWLRLAAGWDIQIQIQTQIQNKYKYKYKSRRIVERPNGIIVSGFYSDSWKGFYSGCWMGRVGVKMG